MSDEKFDVVFFGILQAGRDKDTVIQNMAKLFKTDVKKLTPYFSGGRKVIKGNINAASAEKYKTALENVGLVIKLEAYQAPDESSNKHSDNKETASTFDTGNLTVAPVGANVSEHIDEAVVQKIEPLPNVTLAEAGADVIENPISIPAQPIEDISDITMAEVGVNVIENPVEKPVQEIDELSNLTLAEAGADIIENPEPVKKTDIPDISELTLEN